MKINNDEIEKIAYRLRDCFTPATIGEMAGDSVECNDGSNVVCCIDYNRSGLMVVFIQSEFDDSNNFGDMLDLFRDDDLTNELNSYIAAFQFWLIYSDIVNGY